MRPHRVRPPGAYPAAQQNGHGDHRWRAASQLCGRRRARPRTGEPAPCRVVSGRRKAPRFAPAMAGPRRRLRAQRRLQRRSRGSPRRRPAGCGAGRGGGAAAAGAGGGACGRVRPGQGRLRLLGRRLPAPDPVLGRHAQARQPGARALPGGQAAGAGVRLRDGDRRAPARAAGQLHAAAHQARAGRHDRSEASGRS